MAADPKQALLDGLNQDLQGEFQAIIMYRLYASLVQGPYRQELRAFFANRAQFGCQLQYRHGGVVGIVVPRPRLVPVAVPQESAL